MLFLLLKSSFPEFSLQHNIVTTYRNTAISARVSPPLAATARPPVWYIISVSTVHKRSVYKNIVETMRFLFCFYFHYFFYFFYNATRTYAINISRIHFNSPFSRRYNNINVTSTPDARRPHVQDIYLWLYSVQVSSIETTLIATTLLT